MWTGHLLVRKRTGPTLPRWAQLVVTSAQALIRHEAVIARKVFLREHAFTKAQKRRNIGGIQMVKDHAAHGLNMLRHRRLKSLTAGPRH